MALVVISQTVGSVQGPLGYLSSRLDAVTQEWPGCLRILATLSLPVEETLKFTLEAPLQVFTNHQVAPLL